MSSNPYHGRTHSPDGTDPIPGLISGGSTLIVPEYRSSDTVLGTADHAKAIHATATYTQTLAAAATLGDGWWVLLVNASDDGVIELRLLTNAAGETLDGINTHSTTYGTDPYRMYSGEARLLLCDGSDFSTVMLKGGYVYHDVQSGGSGAVRMIFIPRGSTMLTVDMVGAGAGGGGGRGDAAGTTRKGGAGGGGGGRFQGSFAVSEFDKHVAHRFSLKPGTGGAGGAGGASGSGANGGGISDSSSIINYAGGSDTPVLVVFGGRPGLGGNASANGISGGGGGGMGCAPEIGADNGNSRGAGNPILPGSTGGAGMGYAGGGSSTTTFTKHQSAADWGGGGGGPVGAAGNAPVAGGASGHGGGGGGGGGGMNTSNAVGIGLAGGDSGRYELGLGTPNSAGVGVDGDDWSGTDVSGAAGEGGSGGSGNASGTGYAGGNGGFPGGGGGGGGGGTTTGGEGGDGAHGFIRIWFS